MIWPFKKPQHIEDERAVIKERIAVADATLEQVNRRWPTVESLRTALVTRRLENGFGEELAVSFTKRGAT